MNLSVSGKLPTIRLVGIFGGNLTAIRHLPNIWSKMSLSLMFLEANEANVCTRFILS